MNNIEDLIYLLFFVIFVIVAIARKFTEQREITKRQEEMRNRKPQEMPETTRRMLYGDDVPTARPRFGDDDDEGPVIAPSRREPQLPTAQPRQQQRRVPPPVAPRQSTQRTATAAPQRPVPPPVRPVAPAPRAETARERAADASTPFRPQEQQRRLAPEQRRAAPPMRQAPQRTQQAQRPAAPPPVVVQPAQQTRRRPAQAPGLPPPPQRPAARKAQRAPSATRFFEHRGELRRAILLREILGPPKAFEGLD